MNLNLADEFSVYLQDLTDRGLCRVGPDGYVLTDAGRWPAGDLAAYVYGCPFKRAAMSFMGLGGYAQPFNPRRYDRVVPISTASPYNELLIHLMSGRK